MLPKSVSEAAWPILVKWEKCHVVHEGNVGGTTAVVEMNIGDTAMNYLLLRISHIWYVRLSASALGCYITDGSSAMSNKITMTAEHGFVLTACHECDLLVRETNAREASHYSALCPRCGALLSPQSP